MRDSELVPQRQGKICLPRSVHHCLRLPSTVLLHGVVIEDQTLDEHGKTCFDHSLVLSPVPGECWDRAFRLSLTTAAAAGSLADACLKLQTLGIDVISLVAVGASLHGDLDVTAVVVLPGKLASSTIAEQQIANAITTCSQSSLAQRKTTPHGQRHPIVILKKLSALARFKSCSVMNFDTFRVKNRILDIHHRATTPITDRPLANESRCTVLEKLKCHLPPGQIPLSALTTCDSEEHYLRVWLAPHVPVHVFECEYTVEKPSTKNVSHNGCPGVLQSILSAMAEPPLRLNIYYADHGVVDRSHGSNPSGTHSYSETTKLRVSGNTSLSKAGNCRTQLKAHLGQSLKHAERTLIENSIASSLTFSTNSIRVNSIYSTRIPVFIATNAKAECDKTNLEWMESLVQKLNDRRLVAVNVDLSLGSRLVDEVVELLSACPLVISIHFPEEQYRLSNHNNSENPRYSPSPWVVFEEATAFGRRGKHKVFRLRHSSVIAMNPFQGYVESVFDDSPNSMSETLRTLTERTDKLLATESFRRKVKATAGLLTDSELFRYDLGLWLRTELEKTVADASPKHGASRRRRSDGPSVTRAGDRENARMSSRR